MPTRLALVLLTLLWSAIYLPGLGTRELQGEEARRVLPGRTMLQSGEWIVPRSGGKVYNRKPPLVNWISAGAISVTGSMDEWTVRTPSTLLILALALCAFVCLRNWLGHEKALLVALISLTNVGFVEKGRLVEIEALYISLFGIALVVWLGLRWQGREVASWVISGIVLGLGFLAKGPVHLLYFYAIVFGILWSEKRLRDLLCWQHFLGLAAFFAMWVPWAVLNALRNPQRDSGAVWAEQITHRLGFVEFDVVNYLLQIPQSLVNLLPWALFLPLVWRLTPGIRMSAAAGDRHAKWVIGIQRGLLWAFLPIALMPSSRPRFMLPLNLPAAILIVEALSLMSVDWLMKVARRWRMSCLVISLVVLSVGVFIAVKSVSWHSFEHAERDYPIVWPSHLACFLALGSSLVIVAWLWRRRATSGSLSSLGIDTGLVLASAACMFTVAIAPLINANDKLRPFAGFISKQIGKDARLMLYKIDEHMWPFYLGQRCYEVSDIKLRPDDIGWVLTGQKTWSEQRDGLEQRLGKASAPVSLNDPVTHEAYVLVSFER